MHIWPQLYPHDIKWMVINICVVVVFAFIVARFQSIPRPAELLSRIFRFHKSTEIITAVFYDRDGQACCSENDRNAATKIGEMLNCLGLQIRIDHSDSKSVAQEIGRSMVLVGGPSMNKFSDQINRGLAVDSEWYRGFYFDKIQSLSGETGEDLQDKYCWVIKHKGMDVHVTHTGIMLDKKKEDTGIIYVGPNPVNKNRWLMWIAGLSSGGTYGAAKSIYHYKHNLDFVELLGGSLFNNHRYCSALIRYRYDASNPANGEVTNFVVCGGRIP